MHVSSERLHVFDRSHRQNSVPQIEDVTGDSARAHQDIVSAGNDSFERTEQQRWIEVALDRAVVTDPVPRSIERSAPIGADHVAAGLAQLRENRARADAEMDR